MTTLQQGYRAKHRYARITQRKARLIADLIRGRSANEAFELLEFAPQRAATFYVKVLKSAVANAAQDEGVDLNRLVVVEDGLLVRGLLGEDRVVWGEISGLSSREFRVRNQAGSVTTVRYPADRPGARALRRGAGGRAWAGGPGGPRGRGRRARGPRAPCRATRR